MKKWKSISEIRRDYGNLALSEHSIPRSPFVQFEQWFQEVFQTEVSDPTAMVLSTVDEQGRPDSRVVLLKGLDENAFVFFTNYDSAKGLHLAKHPYAALNFYWPQTARQVRVRGTVKKVSSEQSDEYFASRPVHSQISAIISPQSQSILGRSDIEHPFNELLAKHQETPVKRPDFWGGYCLIPEEFEFWQGRDNRLHDRIFYLLQNGVWQHKRLAP